MRQLNFTVIIFLAIISFISCVSGELSDSDQTDNSNDENLKLNPSFVDVSSDTQIIDLKVKLESNPDDPEVNYNLGMRYLELGRPDLARDGIAKAIELDASNVDYKIANANIYADEGKTADAENLFKEILENDENNTDALVSWGVMYYILGVAYEDEEKINIAEEKFNQVLDIDSENIKAHFNLGLLYLFMNETEKARINFEAVHELEPDGISAIKHLARITLENDDWDSCRKYSQRGMKIEEYPQFVYYLGRVAYEKKEYKDAEELFERFLGMPYIGPLEADARARLFELKGI